MHREPNVLPAGERDTQLGAIVAKHKKERTRVERTSAGLRDVLFDEIEELRSGHGDPPKAMAVANLARQIVGIAKVELDFHRQSANLADGGHPVVLGNMPLGRAISAEKNATAA